MQLLTTIAIIGIAMVIYIGFFVTLLTVIPLFAIWWITKSVINDRQHHEERD